MKLIASRMTMLKKDSRAKGSKLESKGVPNETVEEPALSP